MTRADPSEFGESAGQLGKQCGLKFDAAQTQPQSDKGNWFYEEPAKEEFRICYE